MLLEHANPRRVGLSMASDIGQSFPDDSEQLLLKSGRKQGQGHQFSTTWDACRRGKALNLTLHGLAERALVGCCRPQIINSATRSSKGRTRTLHDLLNNL